jgi:hypothetical protein
VNKPAVLPFPGDRDRAGEEALPPELLRFIRALAEADEAEDYARQLSQTTKAGQGQR